MKPFYLPLPFADYEHVARLACCSANKIIKLSKQSRAAESAWVEFTSQGDRYKLIRRFDSLELLQVTDVWR